MEYLLIHGAVRPDPVLLESQGTNRTVGIVDGKSHIRITHQISVLDVIVHHPIYGVAVRVTIAQVFDGEGHIGVAVNRETKVLFFLLIHGQEIGLDPLVIGFPESDLDVHVLSSLFMK